MFQIARKTFKFVLSRHVVIGRFLENCVFEIMFLETCIVKFVSTKNNELKSFTEGHHVDLLFYIKRQHSHLSNLPYDRCHITYLMLMIFDVVGHTCKHMYSFIPIHGHMFDIDHM